MPGSTVRRVERLRNFTLQLRVDGCPPSAAGIDNSDQLRVLMAVSFPGVSSEACLDTLFVLVCVFQCGSDFVVKV